MNQLEMRELIGEGSFGQVMEGTYFGKLVAIKKLKNSILPKVDMDEFR
ncbi:unnamed protein product [Discosporangium mesarthrocarpum]